jgi:hypothetical protein
MRYLSVCSGIESASIACSRCRVAKPVDDFHRAGKKGRHDYCRDCFNAYKRQRGPVDPAMRRTHNLWTRYRITPADVDRLIAGQCGLCAMCDKPLPDRYHIDHSHTTGKVRGVLCHRCNVRIGGLEDAEFRARAVAYLERGA